MPFREKGLAVTHQIENYFDGEMNPYYHTSQDNLAHLSLDYWWEQVKATIVTAAEVSGPVGR